MKKTELNNISQTITVLLVAIAVIELVGSLSNKPTLFVKIMKGIVLECDYRFTQGMTKAEILEPL